jgi:molecular chaperone DnaK
MSKSVTIGIDLGTSNSCVATVTDGEPQVLANGRGERTTASVVAFREDGQIEVGNQAKAQVIRDPKNTVSSAKRLIGRFYFSEEVRKARAVYRYEIVPGEGHSVRIRIRDEEFSLPEISAFVLKEMKQIAEQALGCEVTRAVITVPAYFNDNQRQATKDAGRIAGLEVLRILNEPTAAALAYGYGKDLRKRVAVYDLGGGTFDVSILDIGAEVFEVLSTCGDTYLGGDDFDDRVIDLLADKIQAQERLNLRSDPDALEKLKQAAEWAKTEFSSHDSVRIEIPDLAEVEGRPIRLEYEMSRKEFDGLVRDLVMRTLKVCDEALQQAGLTVRDIDGVILVGGPTRLPTVREAVVQYFQREPEEGINPDEVVAVGAAIHAHSLASQNADTFLLDVTPLTLRLGIVGGLSERIIDRNSPVPIEETRTFTTTQDGQTSVAIRIYQGESRVAAENEMLGEFEFSGFEPGPRGQVQIQVTFGISTEGIVRVEARDPKTGASRSTTVNMTSGLSEEQIQAILERGRTADVVSAGAVGIGAISSDHVDEILENLPDLGGDGFGTPAQDSDELFGGFDEPLAAPDPAEPLLALEPGDPDTELLIERASEFLGEADIDAVDLGAPPDRKPTETENSEDDLLLGDELDI